MKWKRFLVKFLSGIYVWYVYIYISHILLMNSNPSEEIAAIRWKIGTLSLFFYGVKSTCSIHFGKDSSDFLFVCCPNGCCRQKGFDLESSELRDGIQRDTQQDSKTRSEVQSQSSIAPPIVFGFFSAKKWYHLHLQLVFVEWCRHSWLREEGFL